MHTYTKSLSTELNDIVIAEKAAGMKAYMRNQFEFLGIIAPERRIINKDFSKRHEIKNEKELEVIVKELWMLPEREFQYCAIEILLYNKKIWKQETINVIEQCIINKSWWDTVDFLAYDCSGNYFKMFPGFIKTITGRWNASENFWLQRSSLLFQKNYKKDTDTALLSDYILHLASSKEFFIQKAIGWVLREYARTDAGWVRNFVNQHALATLSKREAMKHL